MHLRVHRVYSGRGVRDLLDAGSCSLGKMRLQLRGSRPQWILALFVSCMVLVVLFVVLTRPRVSNTPSSTRPHQLSSSTDAHELTGQSARDAGTPRAPEERYESGGADRLHVREKESQLPVPGVLFTHLERGITVTTSDSDGNSNRDSFAVDSKYVVHHPDYYGGVHSGGVLRNLAALELSRDPAVVVSVAVRDQFGLSIENASVELFPAWMSSSRSDLAFRCHVNQTPDGLWICGLESGVPYKLLVDAPGCSGVSTTLEYPAGPDVHQLEVILPVHVVVAIDTGGSGDLFDTFTAVLPSGPSITFLGSRPELLPDWALDRAELAWLQLEVRGDRDYPVEIAAVLQCKLKPEVVVQERLIFQRAADLMPFDVVELPRCDSGPTGMVRIEFSRSGASGDPHGGWVLKDPNSRFLRRWAPHSGMALTRRLSHPESGVFLLELPAGDFTLSSLGWPFSGEGQPEFDSLTLTSVPDREVVASVQIPADRNAGGLKITRLRDCALGWGSIQIVHMGSRRHIRLPMKEQALDLEWLPEGEYSVIVETPTFLPGSWEFSVVSGQVTLLEVQLDRDWQGTSASLVDDLLAPALLREDSED
jgi:hypothetical protein